MQNYTSNDALNFLGFDNDITLFALLKQNRALPCTSLAHL